MARRGPRRSSTPVVRRAGPVSRALGDALLGSWIEWREESDGVQRAWQGWLNSEPDERAGAFAAYSAALQREEAAATAYARLCARAAALLASDVTASMAA